MTSDDPLECLSTFLNETLDSEQPSVLLAVSGGCDSMVLLDSFARVRGNSVPLYVLHYDHGLGDHADRARTLVTETSRDRGATPIVAAARDPEEMRGTRSGLEGEARRWRYEFFESVAQTLGVDHLFLGHHRLDQVETVLLDLGRGAGPGGLGGMAPVSRRRGLTICRPFLGIDPEELRRYARQRNLEYVEDPTNEDVGFARNRIRHRILPEWREAQPDPETAIVNHARRTRREKDFWTEYLDDRFDEWVWAEEVQLRREQFRGAHPAVQLRYLHHLITEVLSLGRGFDEGNYRDLRSLFEDGRSGARLSLPGSAYAINEYGRGCISTVSDDSWDPLRNVEPSLNRSLNETGTLLVRREGGHVGRAERAIFFSEFRVPEGATVTVRSWSPGDRYEDGGKLRKLKTLFSDQKVPYRARRTWPLILRDERVLAVPGLLQGTDGEGESWWVGFRPDHPTFEPLVERAGDRRVPYVVEPGEDG